MMNTRPRALQSGLSMLELSIAMVIAGMLVLLQLRQQTEDLHLTRLKTESQWVVAVMRDIQKQMGQSQDFSSLSNFTLGAIRSVPAGYITIEPAATTVLNGFGGQVYVSPLSLGGSNNAYALNYSAVPQEDCAQMVVLLSSAASDGYVPLYGVVGNEGTTTAVPSNITLDAAGNISLSTSISGQSVLMSSPTAGLDMSKVAFFCNSARGAGLAVRSLTLLRRP